MSASCAFDPASTGGGLLNGPTLVNRIHLWSKAAVVRVVAVYAATWRWEGQSYESYVASEGTGFFVDARGYVLTNAHVVELIHEGDDAAREDLIADLAEQVLAEADEQADDVADTELLEKLSQQAELVELERLAFVVLQSGTQLPFEIKAYGAPLGEGQDLAIGKDVAVLKVETRNAPVLLLADSRQVEVGNRVFLLGYPGLADLQTQGIGSVQSDLEPTISDGYITARKTSVDETPLLQTNAAAAPGSSGAPAIAENGTVVGLLTFGSDQTGFDFLVPSSTAMEFVRQAGAVNELGAIDETWRRSLEQFWTGQCRYAKDGFLEVLALFPEHREASRLVTVCQERISSGRDRSGWFRANRSLVVLVFAIAGVTLITDRVARRFLSRRKRNREMAVGVPSPVRENSGLAAADSSESRKTEAFDDSSVGRLTGLLGPAKGLSFAIKAEGLSIGRDPELSEAILDDAQVSGRHAWVGRVDGRATLRDMGSTNGTFLNHDLTRRVTETEILDGDVIMLGAAGKVTLRFEKAQ